MQDRDARLDRALQDAHGTGANVRANCPFCEEKTGKPDHRRCLSFNQQNGKWICHKCGSKGQRGAHQYVEVSDEPTGLELPESFVPLWDDVSRTLAPARAYLEKRLPRERWRTVGAGACPSGPMANRVVIPFYVGGQYVGSVGRHWVAKSQFPYLYQKGTPRGTFLFNQDALETNPEDPYLIVEGTFDALALWRPDAFLPDGGALLGKPTERQIETLVDSPRPLAVLMDPDADGLARWLQVVLARRRAQKGRSEPVGRLELPPGRDPDEVPFFRIWNAAIAATR